MVAPVADMIQLPLDTGNTGKKKRTQTRVVGANTVHEDFVVISDPRDVINSFKANSAQITIPAAAQNGTTTGLLWVYNPVSSAVVMQISQLHVMSQFVALAVDLLAGDLRCSRFTFTGVNSGAQVTPAKVDTAKAANVGQVATAWATAVATLVATVDATLLQTMDLVTGGAGHWNPMEDKFDASGEHEEFLLRPGEGLVFWNASAVTTANRRVLISAAWDEFTA
jgi:hypothetical protein